MMIRNHELSVYFDRYSVLVTHIPGKVYTTISNGSVIEEGENTPILCRDYNEAIRRTLLYIKEVYKDEPIVFRTLPVINIVVCEGVPYYICHCRVLMDKV